MVELGASRERPLHALDMARVVRDRKAMRFLHLFIFAASIAPVFAERINHEGRLLGPEPTVAQPVLFNTPEADAVVSAMQIMPVDSPWNEDISGRPVLSNSNAMIAQIIADLDSDRRMLRPFYEMNYVLVPDNQPTQSIRFFNYPNESDLDGGVSPDALYPIPTNLPIEQWPINTGALTLSQWQQDVNNEGGDRHSIIVKPGAGFIWETWLTRLLNGAWRASNGAKFNLNSNALRPAGWTSADAAGLPMFPALVRYDECQRGVVEHAMRIVVKRTRLGPIYPATHNASVGNLTDPNIPAMGQRVRLKAAFTIPATWTREEKAVLVALKKYGAMVADNGGFFSISVCPDDRFGDEVFDHLRTISINNFEVIQTTGANEGPRSPGAPVVDAGEEQFVPFGATAALPGTVTGAGARLWKKGAGPGTVGFGNPAQPATTATFTQPGRYTLLLSAADGVHAVSYDSVAVNVVLSATTVRDGNDILFRFPTVNGRLYRVEVSNELSPAAWTTLVNNVPGTGAMVEVRDTGAFANPRRFYRFLVLP